MLNAPDPQDMIQIPYHSLCYLTRAAKSVLAVTQLFNTPHNDRFSGSDINIFSYVSSDPEADFAEKCRPVARERRC